MTETPITGRPRAVGYVRVSTPGQVKDKKREEEKESIPIQLERIEAHAAYKGWELVGVKYYKDEGISGSKTENRPGLKALLDAARRHEFDYVIVKDLDRFGRTMRDIHNNVQVLRDHGVIFVAINQNIELRKDDISGEAQFGMFTVFSQLERSMIRERTTGGKMRKWREGRTFVGRVPFGYRWNKETNRLEINEEEAKIYLRIVDMYLNHCRSSEDIAIQLQKEGLKCKKRPFTYSGILYILRNSCYYGHYPQNTNVYKDGKRGAGTKRTKELKPADQHIIFHPPPLISKPEWDRIQERIEENKIKGTRSNPLTATFWLREKLICEHCGRKVNAAPRGTHRYYACYWRAAGRKTLEANGKERCILPYLSADALEEAVWSRLLTKLRAPFYRRETIDPIAASDQYEVQIKALETEIKALESEEKRLKAARDRFLDLYGDGILGKPELASKILDNENKERDVSGRIVESKEKLEKLRLAKDNDRAYAEFVRDKGAAIERMLAEMERLVPADRKRVVESLLQGGHIEVSWDPVEGRENEFNEFAEIVTDCGPEPVMNERQREAAKRTLDAIWRKKQQVPKQPEIFFRADFRFNRGIFEWLFQERKIFPIPDPEKDPPTGGGTGKKNRKKINGKGISRPVINSMGHLLVHALQKGQFLAQSERPVVSGQGHQVHVDVRVGLQHAAGLGDLRRGGFASGYALIDQAPVGLRKAGSDRCFMPGGKVSLHPEHVVQDFVGLGKQVYYFGDLAVGVHPLGPVHQGQCCRSDSCHRVKPPLCLLAHHRIHLGEQISLFVQCDRRTSKRSRLCQKTPDVYEKLDHRRVVARPRDE